MLEEPVFSIFSGFSEVEKADPGKVTIKENGQGKQSQISRDLVHNIIPDICNSVPSYSGTCVVDEDGTVVFHSSLEKYEEVIKVDWSL